MGKSSLTLDLQPEEAESLRSFAGAHGLTVSQLVGRFANGLRTVGPASIHPEVLALTGLVPADWDAQADHRQYLLQKHG
jgi:hypothetical protein